MRNFGTNSRWAFHVKFIQFFLFSVMVLQYQIRNILFAFLTGQQFPIQVHSRRNPAFSVKFSIYVHFLVILFHLHITSMSKPMDTMENSIWERFSLIKENLYFTKLVIPVRDSYYEPYGCDYIWKPWSLFYYCSDFNVWYNSRAISNPRLPRTSIFSPSCIFESLVTVFIVVASNLVFVHGFRAWWANIWDNNQESQGVSKDFENAGRRRPAETWFKQ